jgi:hypothetical protein
MTEIPTRPEQFSKAWLADKLGAPAGSLRQFDCKAIGTGQMCDSFRIVLDWDGHDGPSSIVAKCPSTDDASRQIAKAIRNYLLEVSWYRELAGQIPVSCPPCYHAEIADNEVDFALLLGDMAPARQGDQLRGADIAEIETAIAEAARLHAPFWNSERLAAFPWLSASSGNKEIVRTLMPQLYLGFRDRYKERLTPEILEMGDELIARFDGYLDYEPAHLTVTHSDFRIDNLLFHPETGAVTVVDWQTVSAGIGPSDIAYLIGTSIADPDVRKAEEQRLVADYAKQLRALGVSADEERCWEEYRRSAFAGFVMAVFASMNVQRTDRGDEMFAVMAERPAAQIISLESLSML